MHTHLEGVETFLRVATWGAVASGIWWVEARAAVSMGQDTGQSHSTGIPVPECQ